MEPFGAYSLVKRLGAGGMGEVFLATKPGEPLPLVVKRILPHLVENPRFLRLFLDETRIASRLHHPNIARITELGEVEGTWFVAMEYVAGKDLREVLKRSREVNHHVPLEVAVAIAIEVAKALGYAHDATDAQGRLLKIVHRDVSPHNILIGKHGEVKVIDFGVAKAANKSMHTAAGILKGKFPYMAPEQAHALPVDPRTDVFALGIVLWEMICARYLFRGKTDAATLRLVREAEVPKPSTVRDDVPTALDRVILKALKKDAAQRYQSMAAFAEALEGVLSSMPAPDLAKWLREYDDVPGLDGDEADSVAPSEAPSARSAQSAAKVATGPQEEATVIEPVPEPVSVATVQVRARSLRTDVIVTKEEDLGEALRLLSQVTGIPTNITPQPTSFIGRVAELADLQQLFRQGVRLITLLGPGGTGKTRLSLQFGSQLISHFNADSDKGLRRGGVWFCDLTEASDVDSLCSAVARALAVPLVSGDVVQQLGHAILARGEVLLVLDNFEQVVAHAPATVAKWMRIAPAARFVVSSRELLKIADETIFEVPPLRTPREQEDARASEAVALFIERSRTVRPGWEPSEPELKAIAEIVRQLDGMPLAIELAAARMSVLNPSQLVLRLPRRFDLLVDRRGATERQATLRGAIDWSWNMLSQTEASTLAQLAVFHGGFSAEAVPQVVSLAHLPNAEAPLELMMTLRSKSLVRAYFPLGDERETRFGLYESIREYAREKLGAMPEAQAALERHSKYYLTLGPKLAERVESQRSAMALLELERDNLFAVYRRAMDSEGPTRDAAEAVLVLERLMTLRGPYQLLSDMLDAAVAKLDPSANHLRALTLEARGRTRHARGKMADAMADLTETLELAGRERDRSMEGRAELYLSAIDRARGQRQDSRRRINRALSLFQSVNDRRMYGRGLSILGTLLHDLGLETESMDSYNESLEILREVGDRWYEGITLINLGVPQQALGLFKQARANYQAGLAVHREVGNRRGEGFGFLNLGDICADLEQPGAARSHYESALGIFRGVGVRRPEGATLVSLGLLHLQYGELDDAAQRLAEGIDILDEVAERASSSIARAALAAIAALNGHLEDAEAQMADATRRLTQVGDRGLLDALELYRAHLELGHALVTRSELQAGVLIDRVKKRIAFAESTGPADDSHPTGTPSPAARSEHVRTALRSIRGALIDHGKDT